MGAIVAPFALQRLPDWPARLAAVFEERRHMAYAYGINDCGVIMREAVRAVTGTDVLGGEALGTSWLAAAKFMIRRGWDDVEAAMTDLVGPPLARTAFARRGDIVSFEELGERHLAVCVGATAATPGATGLLFVPMTLWCSAWKVG